MFFYIISTICIYCYYKYGYYYARGMSLYVNFNNTHDNIMRESSMDSIINETIELYYAIKSRKFMDIILEASDVGHSLLKYIVIDFMPKIFICSLLPWSLIFFIFPFSTIKLGNRYKYNNCIRNHKNQYNYYHKCNYIIINS